MAASLSSSVTSLQSSLQILDNSISTLDAGVSDFPRLCKVLQTTRVCSSDFIPEKIYEAESNHLRLHSTSRSSLSLHCVKRSNPSLTKSPQASPISSHYHQITSKSLRAVNKASRRNANCKKVVSPLPPRTGHQQLAANLKAAHCGVAWRGLVLPQVVR